jgi:hypothetical protein
MTLKAVVVFYPGSGGAMLSRVLSLSDKTIMGTNGENPQEHSTVVSIKEKAQRFLSWGGYGKDWKENERRGRYSYKIGKSQFIDYKQSALWLIDRLHATEFYVYESQGLWNSNDTFENFIFIDITDQDRAFIEKNQASKLYTIDYAQEVLMWHRLIWRFDNRSYHVPFSSFFDQGQFMSHVDKLNRWLDLELDLDLVALVWKKWLDESQAVWKK